MKANIEVMIQPYSVLNDRSILHTLIEELSTKNKWDSFRSAVAFVRTSGNYEQLLDALSGFADSGGRIDLTFGADSFSGQSGSDYEAIKKILETIESKPNVNVFLYRENGKTFHPKIYLFSNESNNAAKLIIGSSNWSNGGFWKNIEVNTVIDLDLTDADHMKCYNEVKSCFDDYWTED